MSGQVISTVVLPGAVALLLFLVFSYLHEQSRQPYFRAWQLAWAAYTVHFALKVMAAVWSGYPVIRLLANLLLVVMALAILISTRLTRRVASSERREAFRLRWYEMAIAAVGVGLELWEFAPPGLRRLEQALGSAQPSFPLEIWVSAVLAYSSFHFYVIARRRSSFAFRALFFALAFWAVLLAFGNHKTPSEMFGVAGQLGAVPQ